MKIVETVMNGQVVQIRVPESDPRPAVTKGDADTKQQGAPAPVAKPASNKKRSPAKDDTGVRTKQGGPG